MSDVGDFREAKGLDKICLESWWKVPRAGSYARLRSGLSLAVLACGSLALTPQSASNCQRANLLGSQIGESLSVTDEHGNVMQRDEGAEELRTKSPLLAQGARNGAPSEINGSSKQSPHFSQKAREMGHPARKWKLQTKSTLLAKGARNGGTQRFESMIAMC